MGLLLSVCPWHLYHAVHVHTWAFILPRRSNLAHVPRSAQLCHTGNAPAVPPAE